MDQRIYYILPFLIASASIVGVGFFALFKYRLDDRRYLFWVCLSAGWWSLCEGLLYFGRSAETNLIITQFQYLGIVTTPVLTFLLVVNLFGFKTWLTRKRTALLFLFPLAAMAMAWTNSHHGLIWSDYWQIDTGPFPMLGLKHGIFFWILTVYIYIVLLVTTILLARHAVTSAGLHQAQALTLLVPILVVWVLNAIYVFGQNPIPNVDFTSLGFVLTAGAFVWSFYRFRWLDIIPVAKAEIFRSLSDGVIVLDDQNRVIDLNPAATDILRMDYSETVGREAWDIFRDRTELALCLKNRIPGEITIRKDQETRTYDLRLSPLVDRQGRSMGVIVVFRDISERKRLESKLEWLATIDPLTEIYNRRHFYKKAHLELIRAQRYQHPLSILMIDIDHFKKINDCFGHETGDRALKAITAQCQKNLRETDLFGRLGGEEFAVLLPETDREHAWHVAERLRKSMEEINLKTDTGPVCITISIGLTSLFEEPASIEQLLRQADQALYQAKSAGRDCIHLYQK